MRMKHPVEAKRLNSIPTSIFSTMSKLAVEHDAVNLGQGFPDFNGPAWIIEEAFKSMKAGKNQYAPMNGIRKLRQAIAKYQKDFHGMEWDTETEITVTAGATEALFSAMLAVIDPGDEVILFEPFYDSHQANVIIAGGVPRYVTLHRPDFRFRIEEIESLLTDRTSMIVLNNPNNPTGRVFSRSELEAIAEIAEERDLIVLSDEVYEFLTYDENRHIAFASLPSMRERTITVSSTGKTFGMTGWKIGYAMAENILTRAIQKVHQFVTYAVNTPGQHAMAHALGRLDEYLPDFRTEYSRKRDLLFDGLQETVFTPHLPEGSYFMMADIPSSPDLDDIECAKRLVFDYGVASIPPSVFYASSVEGASLLRFCFAKTDETLRAGIERLKKYR